MDEKMWKRVRVIMTILHPSRTALHFSLLSSDRHSLSREVGSVKSETGMAAREKFNDHLLHFPF